MGSASNSKSSGAVYFHRDPLSDLLNHAGVQFNCIGHSAGHSEMSSCWYSVNAWSQISHAYNTLSSHTISPSTTQLSSQEKTQSNNLSPTPNG
jgi:hypothetical protein